MAVCDHFGDCQHRHLDAGLVVKLDQVRTQGGFGPVIQQVLIVVDVKVGPAGDAIDRGGAPIGPGAAVKRGRGASSDQVLAGRCGGPAH